MTDKMIKLRVERIITEQSVVEFRIDQEDFEEWIDGAPGGTEKDYIDYLVAHRDWPENIECQIPPWAVWREQYRDYVLMVGS